MSKKMNATHFANEFYTSPPTSASTYPRCMIVATKRLQMPDESSLDRQSNRALSESAPGTRQTTVQLTVLERQFKG